MRSPVIAAVVLFSMVIPAAAKGPYWDGDKYLECLVGKGAVDMRHGSTPAKAVATAKAACVKAMEPPGSAAAADGDYVDYAIRVAQDVLQAAADQGGIF